MVAAVRLLGAGPPAAFFSDQGRARDQDPARHSFGASLLVALTMLDQSLGNTVVALDPHRDLRSLGRLHSVH